MQSTVHDQLTVEWFKHILHCLFTLVQYVNNVIYDVLYLQTGLKMEQIDKRKLLMTHNQVCKAMSKTDLDTGNMSD